ncbi:MAG: SDR family oxidoreductase [Deltaproteobacteria bacterium]|nr:SDR family oxidoreductase [Deltaproteobacteria bacterium]
MRVLVIGANGKVGRQVVALLGPTHHEVLAMVRDPAQASALEATGARAVVADLEEDVTDVVSETDAVVFTAGSGGSTGGDKTLLVDLWGAIKTIRAAEAAGVKRYLMVSAIHAADPDQGRPAIRHYMVAKALADERLEQSTLDYAILRPGRLNDGPGTGLIRAGEDIGYGEISRADVARTIVATLECENTIRRTFCILAGETPIGEALARL